MSQIYKEDGFYLLLENNLKLLLEELLEVSVPPSPFTADEITASKKADSLVAVSSQNNLIVSAPADIDLRITALNDGLEVIATANEVRIFG